MKRGLQGTALCLFAVLWGNEHGVMSLLLPESSASVVSVIEQPYIGLDQHRKLARGKAEESRGREAVQG
jgi:hypothetical protein